MKEEKGFILCLILFDALLVAFVFTLVFFN